MAAFLLDTNVISELGRLGPARALFARFRLHETSCALAATTMEELAYGIARMPDSSRRRNLETWFDTIPNNFDLLPYDPDCATWLGRERARLEGLGHAVPMRDGQIAAVAVRNDLTLVTRNTRDFARFSDLRVENWFED
jgi:tRNA(fMet)-specific endonuclease VapC